MEISESLEKEFRSATNRYRKVRKVIDQRNEVIRSGAERKYEYRKSLEQLAWDNLQDLLANQAFKNLMLALFPSSDGRMDLLMDDFEGLGIKLSRKPKRNLRLIALKANEWYDVENSDQLWLASLSMESLEMLASEEQLTTYLTTLVSEVVSELEEKVQA